MQNKDINDLLIQSKVNKLIIDVIDKFSFNKRLNSSELHVLILKQKDE